MRNASGDNYGNSSFIVDEAMGQIQNAFLVFNGFIVKTVSKR